MIVGNREEERGSLARAGLEQDTAIMSHHEAFADSETDTDTAVLARRVETIEYLDDIVCILRVYPIPSPQTENSHSPSRRSAETWTDDGSSPTYVMALSRRSTA